MGQDPVLFGLEQRNRDPTIGAVCGENLCISKYNSSIWQDQVHIKQVRIRQNLQAFINKMISLISSVKEIGKNIEKAVYIPPILMEATFEGEATSPTGEMIIKPCNKRLMT